MFRLKGFVCSALVIFFLSSGIWAQAAEKTVLKPATENEKISYSLGFNLGKKILKDYPISLDLFFQGVKDSKGAFGAMTGDEMEAALASFQQLLQQQKMSAVKKMIAVNIEAGQAFLDANKTKEGVVTLPSGLQYKVIKKGDGPSPKATDTVRCHYTGKTLDGKEFDSSYKKGQPATFQVGGVIKGWTEALQLMSVGSKWMLYIPEHLAYGKRGAGEVIEPGAALIFEVELLGIEG
ncbi:MAG: FKBP-type peptidyl-prolyl cis-trans isomerase [Pseudomonadota bacterium]